MLQFFRDTKKLNRENREPLLILDSLSSGLYRSCAAISGFNLLWYIFLSFIICPSVVKFGQVWVGRLAGQFQFGLVEFTLAWFTQDQTLKLDLKNKASYWQIVALI